MATMIDSVKHVVVVTGAGFSAPSGLPVYREGSAGWLDAEGEYLSHASRYAEHLNELWPRWHHLARLAKDAEPNPAHLALARWERRLRTTKRAPGSLTIITQNLDGLHQRAGNQSVLEVHGTILKVRKTDGPELFDYTASDDRPPQAPDGSTLTRPDVVLFGEQPRHMEQAIEAVQRADLVIFAGTSGNVWPVAGLLDVASQAPSTRTMLLNKTTWDHGHFDIVVLEDVLALDQIIPPTKD